MSTKERKDKHHGASGDSEAMSAALAADASAVETSISSEDYQAQLHVLQIELVKLQRHFIGCGDKILVVVEGRDAAGKDGSIKRIVEYLSPRDTRVVALGKPSDREQRGWYFQRYISHLPVAEEFVLFNRSWYNRAGVEHVMGFCSKEEHEEFMHSVPKFEEMLVNSGIKVLKYYLDIDKDEQVKRLAERQRDPLKQWKSSPVDAVAVKHWKAYSAARDAMLLRTHTAHCAREQQAIGAFELDPRHPVPAALCRQEEQVGSARHGHCVRIHARLYPVAALGALTVIKPHHSPWNPHENQCH
jgi:polyphosphate kinase 2